MKRITLSILLLLFIQLGVSASANNSYDNFNSTYDAVKPPENPQLIGEFSGENLSQAFLSTNETGQFKNRTSYGIKNISNQDPVNATFNWTNRNDIVQPTTVGWKVWANTTQGSYISTNTSTFNLIEYPVIESILTEDIAYRQGSRISARVTDIVGRDDVQNVTFDIESPDGETYSLTGTKGEKINQSGREGYVWSTNFSQTASEGIYQVNVTAEDESMSTTDSTQFEITAPLFPSVPGFTFNPFSIGGESITGAIGTAVKQRTVMIITGTLIGLGVIVVFLAYLGRGYEENEYTEVPQKTGRTNKL